MPTYYSGVGGNVSVLVLDGNFDPVAVQTFDVASWTLQDSAEPADLTNASTPGSRAGTKGTSVSWSFALPVAVGAEPESNGLTAGTPTQVWFRVGTAALWHRVENTMVVSTSPVCNAVGDVVRIVVTGIAGDVAYYIPSPPAMSSPPPPPPTGYVSGGGTGVSVLGGGASLYPPGGL